LTQFTTRAHLARTTLESACYQTRDIVEVMARDVGAHMTSLRFDGGIAQNNLLIQLQADILGIPIGTFHHVKLDQRHSVIIFKILLQ
jgi:glycerol kinase